MKAPVRWESDVTPDKPTSTIRKSIARGTTILDFVLDHANCDTTGASSNRKDLTLLARTGALNNFDGIGHRSDALWQVERTGKPGGPKGTKSRGGICRGNCRA
jgi:hypothetical protein